MGGLKICAEYGIRFDALLKKEQLYQLEVICREIPSLKIVIDHAAKPDIAGDGFCDWVPLISKAAELPVLCKISGLLTEADHKEWTEKDIQPYVDELLRIFGTERLMFGSDWPVSTMAADYDLSVKTIQHLLQSCSSEERENLLFKNAKEFYGIE